MTERRKFPRRASYLGGRIVFNHRSSTVDCLLRNISETGAKLTFSSSVPVPDVFEVVIHKKSESRQARMIWRRMDEAGVVFLETGRESAPVPIEWVRRLRQCERDKAALKQRIEQLTTGDC